MRRAAPFSLALLTAIALQAGASDGQDPGGCEVLRTINATGNKIWVTVYNAIERQTDYGWVDACTVRTWRAGSYSCGSYYHVRAEVKPYDVNAANVYDTRVQFNPQFNNYTSQVVTLRRGKDNYYWEHGNTAGCTPNGMNHCCGADYQEPQGSPAHYNPPPPPPPGHVQFTFDNTTNDYVLVRPYTPTNNAFQDVCVPPGKPMTWSIVGSWEYRVRATPHAKGCDDGHPGTTHVGATKTVNGAASLQFLFDPKTRLFGFPH
jgi:hypothetical protein